jgi:hypothetical protein
MIHLNRSENVAQDFLGDEAGGGSKGEWDRGYGRCGFKSFSSESGWDKIWNVKNAKV